MSDGQPSTLGALVHSSSEHTLAAGWLAEDLGVDLGQIGFYDQFTVMMNRRVLTVLIQDVQTLQP